MEETLFKRQQYFEIDQTSTLNLRSNTEIMKYF